MVFELRHDRHIRELVAFGVRHHPRESHAATVYQIAHHRLHEDA
jgi:hypothetical protein